MLNVVILMLRSNVQILKVATNGIPTLHLTIFTGITLDIYNNNNQQFNRHDFR